MLELSNLKNASIDVLKNMPTTSSLEDLMNKIDLTAKIIEGLKDKEAGNVLTTKELLQEIEGWK